MRLLGGGVDMMGQCTSAPGARLSCRKHNDGTGEWPVDRHILTHWVISLFGLVLHSAESLSELTGLKE